MTTEEKNNTLGETLRAIRTSKHLSLKDMTGGQFTESMLSKFERGKTQLTIDKFLTVLQNANIYLDEFQSIHSHYASLEDPFKEELSQAGMAKDTAKIKSLLKTWTEKANGNPKNKSYQVNLVVIKAVLALTTGGNLLKEDLLIAADYLDEADEWGRYEVWIFGNLLPFFDDTMLKYYGAYLLDRTLFYQNNLTNQRLTVRTFLNLIDTWLKKKNLPQALKYITHLNEIHFPRELFYEKILLRYHEGHYLYLKGNPQGMETMKNCVQTLETYGYPEIAQFWNDELQHL